MDETFVSWRQVSGKRFAHAFLDRPYGLMDKQAACGVGPPSIVAPESLRHCETCIKALGDEHGN